ncbi:MAG: N-acetylmuramoyl-L-alanine amidase [Pseudomonadota bacterium]
MSLKTRWHPSPNFGDRRNDLKPELIVLHYTEMASCADALDRLCDPEAEVSSHYLISEQGEVLQLVTEEKRAWHAGQGSWRGRPDVNSRSIGIELSNKGVTPFSALQMDALEALLAEIMERWSVPDYGVIAHSDFAPTRKTDPGRRFDWRRLALGGLSVWPEGSSDSDADFLSHASAFGYPTEDGEPAVLEAFRQRFRPMKAVGSPGPDETDRAMMANLARRFGIDRTD